MIFFCYLKIFLFSIFLILLKNKKNILLFYILTVLSYSTKITFQSVDFEYRPINCRRYHKEFYKIYKYHHK